MKATSITRICFSLVLVALCMVRGVLAQDEEGSRYTIEVVGTSAHPDSAQITFEVYVLNEADKAPPSLPVRAIVRDSEGRYADGSGMGVYDDGRFFAAGSFMVQVPGGTTLITLNCGPNYIPLRFSIEVEAGSHVLLRAEMKSWFVPEKQGWYGGDNHVHAQHDRIAAVKTSLGYTALQARANGLGFITEAGSNVSYDAMDTLSTSAFLFGYGPELRPGPFVGHLNTPGIRQPIPGPRLATLMRAVLPVQGLRDEVHRRGGALIHTHPMTPPQQLHWMGAAELFSDAVLGRTADALDQDTPATRMLWFAALNLGNAIAASGYTDAALGRKNAPSPGDRRIYTRLDTLTFPAIVNAIRTGRTFATNGGPLFSFLTLDGHEVGDTLILAQPLEATVRAEVHTLYPLTRIHLYRNGRLVHAFNGAGQTGQVEQTLRLSLPAERAWYVLRAESEGGHWAMTSPIYVEPVRQKNRPFAAAVVFQISNATRFIELRRDFYAHLLATVAPEERLASVELLRDNRVIHRFMPSEGDRRHEGRTPVTEINGEYGPGWAWYPSSDSAVHLQADWPVSETGWYTVRATTASGITFDSDALYFDAGHPNSRQIGVAHLVGDETHFRLHGYGEEMPLTAIQLPFEGDHWWYPENTYYHVEATFGDEVQTVGADSSHPVATMFRKEGRRGQDD